MLRRLLPLSALVVLLALPAGAGAGTIKLAPFPETGADALTAKTALRKAEAVTDGRRYARGTDLTPLLRKLAASYPHLPTAEKRRAARLLARPTKGDPSEADNHYTVAEHAPICSAHFCVHYVTTTHDAPPLTDSNGNGVPDYVDQVSA